MTMTGPRYCQKCARHTIHAIHQIHDNISAECVRCHLVRTPEEVAHDNLIALTLAFKRSAYNALRILSIMSVSGEAIYDFLSFLGSQFEEK